MLIQRRRSTPADWYRWFPPREKLPLDREERCGVLQQAFERFSHEAVATIDEHGVGERVPLPIYGDHQYLRVLVQQLVRWNRVYILKSRKVSATWLMLEWNLWNLTAGKDRLLGYVTMKEGDGIDILDRYVSSGLIASLPDWVHNKVRYTSKVGEARVEVVDGELWNGTFKAYPRGADQLRVFGHTLVTVDEAHIIPDLDLLLKGISPGLRAQEGKPGGQLVLVGVGRRGSHFHRLLDASGLLEQARAVAMEHLSEAA